MTFVLSAHRGNDTGGTGYRIAKAFQAGPDQGWVFHSACNPSSVLPYLEYPEDLPWDRELIRSLFADADVFHARNNWSTYLQLAVSSANRPATVIHYHGTNFRTLWGTRLREQKERRALALVSTLDLWLIRPEELEWLPSPYDVDWLQRLPKESA